MIQEPRIRISLLGALGAVNAAGETSSLQPMEAAIPALLAIKPGIPRSRDEIAAALWPGVPTTSAKNSLRKSLAILRSKVGDDLFPPNSGSYIIDPECGPRVDVIEFERLAREGWSCQNLQDRIGLLRQASELYKAPLLPTLGDLVPEIAQARARYDFEYKRILDALPATPAVITRSRAPKRVTMPIAAALIFLAIAVFAFVSSLLPVTPDDQLREVQCLDTMVARRGFGAAHAQGREAELCVALGEEAWAATYSPAETDWADRLAKLDGPVQRSLGYLLERNPDRAQQLAGALSRYWYISNRREAERRWLDAALGASGEANTMYRARALTFHAMCICDAATKVARPNHQTYEAAYQELVDAQEIYSRLKDAWGVAETTRCMGHNLKYRDIDQQAEAEFREALALFAQHPEDVRFRVREADTWWGLALIKRPGESGATRQLRNGT